LIAAPPALSEIRLAVGITGHRSIHPALATDPQPVTQAITAAFARIGERLRAIGGQPGDPHRLDPPRLHTLLADGVDQIAADAALGQGWEVVSELPFGRSVNLAVSALPQSVADARALLDGKMPGDPQVELRASRLRQWSDKIRLFELADRDHEIEALMLARLEAPDAAEPLRQYNAATSAQVALAGRIMIEQSDLLVGVWDGKSRDLIGGTGHTIVAALEAGLPVLLIDPDRPALWSVVSTIEELAGWQDRTRDDAERLLSLIHI
jgi:hypothetical protein